MVVIEGEFRVGGKILTHGKQIVQYSGLEG